jgi:Uma2 family endonuclease
MAALPFSTNRPWTIADLDSMPKDGQRYELLQGELIASPAPGKIHQRLIGRMHIWLDEAATRAGSGEVVIAPADVRLSQFNLVQPDLLYLRESQSGLYGDKFIDGAPAFVIEIVSPSSGVYDRVRKASLYMESGVEEYWVVEPTKRHILIHRAGQDMPNSMIVTSGTIFSTVLPESSFNVEDLFASVADRPRTPDH